MVDETVRLNLLFDFYGRLLTERQRRIFVMYYEDDLSLGEIAEQFEVSRQAVYDILKRSAKSLEKFERQLRLVARHMAQRSRIEELAHRAAHLQERVPTLSLPNDGERQFLEEEVASLIKLVHQIHAAAEE